MNARLQGAKPNLVAYYPLNEGEGTAVCDHSPNLKTAQLANGALWDPGETVFRIVPGQNTLLIVR